MNRAAELELSIVVPIFNEAPNLRALHEEICDALSRIGRASEVIYVDDRSTDGSLEILLELQATQNAAPSSPGSPSSPSSPSSMGSMGSTGAPRVRVIRFRRNFGQTAALAAGFEHSRGRVVVTLDGDLQNDPADIPALLAEIDRGSDVVAGWRRRRQDALVLRRVPSWLANRLISLATGARVHDTGCTLKAFRRDLVRRLAIYAEQHRFLPALAMASGGRVREIQVNHRPRRAGQSKYGIGRAARVLLDLLVILLISRFSHRPLHYFGLLSLVSTGGAFGLLFMSTVDWNTFTVVDKWIQFSVFVFLLLLLLVVYFVLLGLLSELAVTASGMHRRRVLDRLLTQSQ